MSEKLNIEELLKTTLEGKEITPSTAVWKRTARMTRRRQFMRFNPGRFNIYYAVSALIVAGGLGFLIATSSLAEQESTVFVQQNKNLPEGKEPINQQPEEKAASQRSQETKKEATTDPQERESSVNSPISKEEAPSSASASDPAQTNTPGIPAKAIKTVLVYFTPSVTEGCAPLTVNIRNNSTNTTAYSWNYGKDHNGSGQDNESQDINGSVTYELPGEYLVTLTATGEDDLQYIHSERITVHPSPNAEFEMDGDNIYNYSLGAVSYNWSVVHSLQDTSSLGSDFQPSLSKAQSLCPPSRVSCKLHLEVSNQFGCKDTISKLLPRKESPKLTFPTAFSPQGPSDGSYNPNDQYNHIFHPTYNEAPLEYNLKIYNRAGELVFESNDIQRGWDGYYEQSPAASGVYIWKCAGQWNNRLVFEKQGDVTLIRPE